MKLIVEHDRLHRYFSMFHLDQFFSRPESLPVQIRAYERNERVLTEGDELDGLYFQVEGRTKVSSSVITGKTLH